MTKQECELQTRIVKKCADNIKDRITGIRNDLKAFIYIRKENLQHKVDDIGGGNIVAALSLMTCLNLLGKVYYCTERSDKYGEDGSVNETEVFVAFIKFLIKKNVDLGLPDNGEVLEQVWSGFRDCLAHLLTAEAGKSVVTYSFNDNNARNVEDILKGVKIYKAFCLNDNQVNWQLNCDALLGRLSDITYVTINHLLNQKNINTSLLLKVVRTSFP